MTLEQTLQTAIIHHKADELVDAERLYRAILSEQANHPDANHNLGVILKQDDKAAVALAFFKTALESNPNQGQYWISYIDALIHLGQLDAARSVLEQGQSKGLKGDAIDQLAERLNLQSEGTSTRQVSSKPIKPERLLSRAKTHAKKGEIQAARELYTQVLEAYPQNQQAKKGLKALQNGQVNKKNPSGPPQAQTDAVISLYSQGQIQKALTTSEALIQDYPNAPLLYNISGACYKALGQLEASVKNHEQALAIKPDYAEAHSNLGNTLKELGQLKAAVKSYEQALAIKPDLAEAHSNLGNTLKELGQLKAAVKSYEQALAIKPDLAGAHSNLGNTLKELGQLEAAVKSYEQALAIKPDYAEAHSNLGNTLKELGQLEEAVKHYEQALAIKPDYAGAHSNLGLTLQELGQLEAAVKRYEQALAIKPDYAEAHYNLGNTLKGLGQLEAAVKSYEQALAIKPDYAGAHYNLGNTLKGLGQLEAAVKRYEQALAIKPDLAGAHYNLGNTLKGLGQLEAAVKRYEQALAIKPDLAGAHSNLGNTLKELGQLEAAVKRYEQALAIKPDLAEAHSNLGVTLNDLGQLEEAVKSYEKALAIKPDYAEAHSNLGVTLNDLGQLEEAVKSYEKALAIKPDYAEAHYNLGNTLNDLAQLDAAVKSYKQALAIKPDYANVLIQLGICSWIDQDLDKLKSYITSKMDLNKCSKKSLKFVNPYLNFLTRLHKHRLTYPHQYLCNDQSPVIHVIGESHCLTAANSNVEFMGKPHTMKSNIIIGCKAWHLANNKLNGYKKQFDKIERSIPNDGIVFITIGEIDCRLDEGILKFHQKMQNNLVDSIKDLVENFIKYIIEKLARSSRTIIVSGVPCISKSRKQKLTENNVVILSTVLNNFNKSLKTAAINKGLKFLDLYSLTQENPEAYFIDDHHLTPSALVKAIQTKLI